MQPNKTWWKLWLLSIVTCGIYAIYFWSVYGEDLNRLVPSGKKTMHFCLMTFIFSWLTCGIAPLVWQHRVSAKMGQALRERGIGYQVSASTFWLWDIFGNFIVVGPFVYAHKMCTAMNLAAADYNKKHQ